MLVSFRVLVIVLFEKKNGRYFQIKIYKNLVMLFIKTVHFLLTCSELLGIISNVSR
jgi:hypothetical protein